MNTYLLLFVLAVCLAYSLLIVYYRKGWQQTKVYSIPAGFMPQTFISVIIPARNEAANIEACILSVLQQDYPTQLLELIIIDDFSEDATARIIQSYAAKGVRYVALKDYVDSHINAYKKKALGIGIALSKGELVVTSDADCTAGENWLRSIAAAYEAEKAQLIIAPVNYTPLHSTLSLFQETDFLTMQGITAAVHYYALGTMSNGANLAFSKAAYHAVNGYEDTVHLASGDDVMLAVKIKKALPQQSLYLKNKEAIVHTRPQETWAAFLRQRIRWASKSGKYDDIGLTLSLLLVYMFNVILLVLSILSFCNPAYFLLLLLVFSIKILTEYFFIKTIKPFFDKKISLAVFAGLQVLHVLYIVSAGFLGMIGTYSWKGRKVK